MNVTYMKQICSKFASYLLSWKYERKDKPSRRRTAERKLSASIKYGASRYFFNLPTEHRTLNITDKHKNNVHRSL